MSDSSQEVPHEGGFRAQHDISTERGGPHYAEFSEQVRTLMDTVRYACPTDELAVEAIAVLEDLNAKLAEHVVDEWTSPAGTRVDLPSRGNITLPPYEITEAGPDGVRATVWFRPFHLGGNGVAHGGQVAVAFDDLGGMASALAVNGVCRTAYLKVNYRSLTPLNTSLQMRTWVEKRDGRKLFVSGTLHDGDRLCADIESLFIELKPGQP
ncbi:hypothetical protein GOARA_088_00220 [Gordonia araii NBRC 100433]|uniref:Acyl-coenzyme A thioesterase THEM4 n=1 Tax=Gordonia araii NBRC 100433 TaxID=1073574 RepID=G7H7D4_9ACTN|nr:PaaI family thioesterase [Gordonia araii]NNG98442.1 PaaI family thioesterase [Gordonia araii NBRC 100433]GAB11759.1 hypothetical protein GOARA_088_00220 [Gordonia araii NBRC 100433]